MSWDERLKDAEITTPDGRVYPFLYEDVSKQLTNKTTRFTFADKRGAYVPNFGAGALEIPLTIIFNGENYDFTANAFDVSIGLPGTCTLKHPMYGIRTIVVETVRRTDRLKTGGNEAVFEIDSVETISIDSLIGEEEIKSSLFGKIIDFVQDAGEVFENAIYSVVNNEEFNFAKSRWNTFVNAYAQTFDKVVNSTNELRNTFDATLNGVKDNIDTLLTKPQELASAITNAFRIPASAPVLAQTKNTTYYAMIQAIQKSNPGIDLDAKNDRLEMQANLAGLMVGVCESNLLASEDGKSFVTRTDAINAALELIDNHTTIQEFLDNEQVKSEASVLENRFIVSDLNTANLNDIVKITAGNLIKLSFTLKQERIIQLTKDTPFIKVCSDLYGTTENDTLDFFEKTNKMEGDDYILLPKGRLIKYYV